MFQPLSIGRLKLNHPLIQGPLAGYSCAAFRALFSYYTHPAYCVSEMLSAYDVVHKHQINSRLLYRDPKEHKLGYQIAGTDPHIMAEAAARLEAQHADLIDINCGCPKAKIRKKGAGSALLEDPRQLTRIVERVRKRIKCPLTVKIRLQDEVSDINLVRQIQDAGADAIIVHGRRYDEDYDKPCNLKRIASIKHALYIPVIANGDIQDASSLSRVMKETGCDGYMISRASTGKPWLFQTLLETGIEKEAYPVLDLFIMHLSALTELEGEHQAVLQSKSLVRYYFEEVATTDFLKKYYQLGSLSEIESMLNKLASTT